MNQSKETLDFFAAIKIFSLFFLLIGGSIFCAWFITSVQPVLFVREVPTKALAQIKIAEKARSIGIVQFGRSFDLFKARSSCATVKFDDGFTIDILCSHGKNEPLTYQISVTANSIKYRGNNPLDEMSVARFQHLISDQLNEIEPYAKNHLLSREIMRSKKASWSQFND